MVRTTLLILILFSSAASGLFASTQETPSSLQAHEFTLENASPGDAATSLRTIIGTRAITLVGGPVVTIRDSNANVALAEKLIGWIDRSPEGGDFGEPFFEQHEDSTVLGVRLRHAKAREVMSSLREVVQSRRIAASEPGRFVLVRDSADKVEAARDLIERMDRAPTTD